jgi:leader peptidase (prepilin peptidase)/N-methyltransferase
VDLTEPLAPLRLAVAGATLIGGSAVVVAWAHRPLAALSLAAFTAVLGALVDVDLRERRLPNAIVGPLAASTVAVVAVAGVAGGDLGRTAAALVSGLLFSTVLLAMSFIGPLGMGDVKVAFPIGAVAGWLGLAAVQATILTTTVSGALVAGALLLAGRSREHLLPYGPFLALGSLAGMLAGAPA